MTLPANWSTVTVTHKYGSVGGEPIKGYVGFANTVRLTDAAAGLSVPPSAEPVKLDNTGAFSLPLPVCDDPDIAPTGWYYRVTENLTMPDGSLQVNTYLVQLTASMAPSVDLADLVPVTDVAEVTPYARLGVEVVTLPAPSGVDDTAAVNAALTKHAGKRIAGRPGAAYRISAPLVVYSGTTLDMTSCTVTLIANSNCNLLNNAAVAATATRDTDITVRGGTWVRPAPNGATNGWDHHSLRFRRVDGLRLDGVRVQTSVGKYAISLGDVTRYAVVGPTFAAFSDGVHIQGPAQHGYVGQVRGSTGDDMVAVTPRDWTAYDDGYGAVTDLTIEDVSGVSTAACLVKILGGSPLTSAQRIKVRGIGGTAALNAVLVGDDTAQANTTGGLIDAVSVENVTASVASNAPLVRVNGSAIRHLRLRGLHFDNAATTAEVVKVSPGSAATIASLTISGLTVANFAAGQPVITVAGTATITQLVVDGVVMGATATDIVKVSGTVTNLILGAVTGAMPTGAVLRLDSGAAAAAVTRGSVSGVEMAGSGGGSLVRADLSGHTLPRLVLANVSLSASAWLADLATTTELNLSGVTTVSPATGIINARATAVLTVKGSGLSLAAGPQGLVVVAGGSVTARTFGLEVDASKLAKVANAMAFNTNAALGCGVGPIVCNGTNWKHLYSDAIY